MYIHNITNQWYEPVYAPSTPDRPQGKPWTHYSAASSGEFNLPFSSAVVIFQNRRAPVAFFMLIALAVFCYLYRIVPGDNWIVSLIILLLIGFFTFGPHVLIVAALPVDLGSRKAASSVTGFIDAMGYAGASITGVGTGILIDKFSWDAAFYFWIAGALIAAVMMTFIWKFELKKA